MGRESCGTEAGSKQSRLVKQISTSIAALSFRAPICHFVPAACLALAFRFAAAFIEDEALAFSFILVFMTFMAAIVCWGDSTGEEPSQRGRSPPNLKPPMAAYPRSSQQKII